MGSNYSKTSELASSELLRKLSSYETITNNDPFWNQLLSFSYSIPSTCNEQRHLEEVTSGFLKNFSIHNCQTHNLASLLHVFFVRADELDASVQCKDDLFTWQAYNALFIIRNICKYFVENFTEEVIIQQFDAFNDKNLSKNLFKPFVHKILSILTEIPVVNVTLNIHLECINLLLTLLSFQIYSDSIAHSFIFDCFMDWNANFVKLLEKLLVNFLSQLNLNKTEANDHGMIYGLTSAVASGLWSVVTLGLASGKNVNSHNNIEAKIALSEKSLLLFLVLCSQPEPNSYNSALLTLSMSSPKDLLESEILTMRGDYARIYETFCLHVHHPHVTLLLYTLLHKIDNFRSYILTRSDIDRLLVPIIKVLYKTKETTSQHLYMSLIVVLILTEDIFFCRTIHDIILKDLSWLNERSSLVELSLGGLLILTLLRTIQYNMTRMKDHYLHINCLAALANMAAFFSNLNHYIAHKLISVFELLVRKHNKAIEKLCTRVVTQSKDVTQTKLFDSNKEGTLIKASAKDSTNTHLISSTTDQPVNGSANAHKYDDDDDDDNSDIIDDFDHEIGVIEEVMRMMLEVFNSCLSNALVHNSSLVYALLYNRHLFTKLANHPSFQDIIFNIEMVFNFFSQCIEKSGISPSVTNFQQIIKTSSVQFKKERLKKFPELKFRYMEEERSDEFFIPYIWSIVCHQYPDMYFNPARVLLFSYHL